MVAATRRVVTGIDGDGRSYVVSDGPAPLEGGFAQLWSTDGPLHEPLPAGPLAEALEPSPGGSWWRTFAIPPDAQMRERLAGSGMAGIDREGFHTTATVDYVAVLEGDVTLVLDTDAVELHAGDCVVQRGTRHAWHNHGERPARMMAVMLSAR